jgi:Na+-driven multidrug efflux pump
VEGSPRSTRTFIGALQLSSYVGLGLGSVLYLFATPLLRTIIGNDSVEPAIFAAALKYVRIRALGMPAAAVIGSSQAGCLGMQDIRSPLYVLVAAALVNFLGDILFVGSTHPLIGGAAGAAWATVISQYAAVAIFMHWLCHKGKYQNKVPTLNVSKAILELTGTHESAGVRRRRRFRKAIQSFRFKSFEEVKREEIVVEQSPNDKLVTVRGFLEGKFDLTKLVRFPDRDTINDFKPYVFPVTTTQVGRVSGYIAMSHVVSSSFGYASMAAQQVIVSLFYCLCPIADSLSLTAQSFMPAISGRRPSVARAAALKKTVANFIKTGVVFGTIMAAAVSFTPLLSKFFTADPDVVVLVNMVTPYLIGFFSVHGFVCASEGLLLGQKDLGFLGKMYSGYFAVVPYFMLKVKQAALSGAPGINLTSIWRVFLAYQVFRFGAWALRLGVLQRRADHDLQMTEVS